MTPINGIVKNGKIEILAPSGCNEGEQVTVWVGSVADAPQLDGDSSPISVAESVKAMEEFGALQLTSEEQDVFERSIREQRRFDMGKLAERSMKIESTFK